MVRFGILMILYVIGGYFIGEYIIKNMIIGIIIGVIVGLVMQYLNYLKEQIKAEEMRMNLEIYNSIVNKKESL